MLIIKLSDLHPSLTSITVIWQVSQRPQLIEMMGNNFTEVTFFILSGSANRPESANQTFLDVSFDLSIHCFGEPWTVSMN